MTLADALHDKRSRIIDKWVEYTLATYESSGFFIKESDSFANPIGGMVRASCEQLFPLLLEGGAADRYQEPLARLMHLRSVQHFTPSQAVAPLNAVKHIARDVLGADTLAGVHTEDLYDFDFAVDLAVLAAFDLFVACREKIYKIRVEEIKSGKQVLTDGTCPSRVLKNTSEIES